MKLKLIGKILTLLAANLK